MCRSGSLAAGQVLIELVPGLGLAAEDDGRCGGRRSNQGILLAAKSSRRLLVADIAFAENLNIV